jgi:hypothetical protein
VAQHDLPQYSDLPVRAGAPAGSSWGVWGDADRLGALNLLTPERVVAAAREVRTGDAFRLDLALDAIDPPLFGRAPFTHTVLGDDDGPGHDDLLDMNTQSSTQWDGFRHVRHREHGWYGGAPEGAHGMHFWASRGLAGRAVLVDVARHMASEGRPLRPDAPDPIEPDDLLAVLESQGTEVEVGDVLLIRTGWLAWYRGLDATARAALGGGLATPGLRACPEMAALLWDLHVAAVAADNPALEVWPPVREAGQPGIWLHPDLLPLLGIPIVELFDLEALAEACAADGRWSCFFTTAPLHVRHGVASPPGITAIR